MGYIVTRLIEVHTVDSVNNRVMTRAEDIKITDKQQLERKSWEAEAG